MSLAPRDPVLHGFLEAELARFEETEIGRESRRDESALDAFLRRWIAS